VKVDPNHALLNIEPTGDMSEDSGKALQSELGSRVCFVKCNVTDETSVQSALTTGLSRFGNQLHGVINCAGVGAPKKVLNKGGVHDLKTFKFVIDVNLIGTFNVLRLGADIMAKQALNGGERGVIINVASVAAFEGQIGQASYSASKAGVVGMTLPIARELAEHGIRVLTVAPGLFETPMLARLPEKARASLAAQVPFPRRLGQPSEFASLVAHLISNQYLNAECVRIDGAIRMAAM
jgi:NAD(P)-dependent dehydrogenase (short-subunit alcohol dehydrogenase family)